MHSQNGSRPIVTNDLPRSTVMPKTNGDRSDYNNHQISRHQIRTKDNGAPQGAFQNGTMKDRNLRNPIGQGLTANSRDNEGRVAKAPAEAGATDEAKSSQPTAHFTMSNSAPSDTAEMMMTNREVCRGGGRAPAEFACLPFLPRMTTCQPCFLRHTIHLTSMV
ncbi:MAG: hypothetical protein AAGA67_05430 [Cyanobacteria bacterium P01_F01_bin.153]